MKDYVLCIMNYTLHVKVATAVEVAVDDGFHDMVLAN